MTAKLYCFGESGNAYKAALTLTLAGYKWEPVFVDFFNGATRTPEYRALNEMGEVPVFVEGEQVLCQSGVIQYEVVKKTGKLGGDSEHDQREILRWVLWDNHKMSSQCGTTRFLMNFLPPEKRSAEVIQYLQGRLLAALKVLDGHLQAASGSSARVRPSLTPRAAAISTIPSHLASIAKPGRTFRRGSTASARCQAFAIPTT